MALVPMTIIGFILVVLGSLKKVKPVSSLASRQQRERRVQGGPLPVISGVISPINGLING